MGINKCNGCDHAYTYIPIGEGNIYQACKLDSKVINAYGCDKNLEDIDNLDADDDEYLNEEQEARELPDGCI